MPTTHTTPIDLRSYHGREFEGVITQADIEYKSKGKISVNNNQEVYCCQNEVNGLDANDKMGFNYSVCVQFQGDSVWNKSCLSSITILDPPSSIDPQWDWKDGEIAIRQKEQYKVCRIHNDIVVFIRDGGATGTYEIEEAYKSGYRKLPTRKLTEITEEMFDKTNLIGRKVMFNDTERTVFGMITRSNGRYLCIHDTEYNQLIHKCKLIEE